MKKILSVIVILIIMECVASDNLTFGDEANNETGKVSFTDLLADIRHDIREIQEKFEKLQKFKAYSKEIEEKLKEYQKREYVESLNESELRSLVFGYMLSEKELQSKLKEVNTDCEARLTEQQQHLQKEIDILRHDKETIETILAVAIILYLLTILIFYRQKLLGRGR